jgi:hemoglobin-like flavoprotein
LKAQINIDILAFTFEAATRDADFTARFFEEFRARHPDCDAVFVGETTQRQQKMLAQAIIAVLAHIDDPSWLEANLIPLGRRHESLGVEPHMYDRFAETLVDFLAVNADGYWPENSRTHWLAALDLVTEIMCQGHGSAT